MNEILWDNSLWIKLWNKGCPSISWTVQLEDNINFASFKYLNKIRLDQKAQLCTHRFFEQDEKLYWGKWRHGSSDICNGQENESLGGKGKYDNRSY